MAGIYIHIPFCAQRCNYCDFHFTTNTKLLPQMVDAICTELKMRSQELNGEVKTIYFGGGTPSVLNEKFLRKITETINQSYPIDELEEFTFEANPEDLSLEQCEMLKRNGVNRLSIGIQSFSESDLRFMNRNHNAKQAIECIQNARSLGFDNLNIDLIYGSPTTSDSDWAFNLETFLALEIPHLSAYALTVEDKTALAHQIKSKQVQPLDEVKSQRHFFMLTEKLLQNGFEHYEVSNFAKPNKYALHNTNYWNGVPYLGVGPSAHSFSVSERSWNVANNVLYIKDLEVNKLPIQREQLSRSDRFNEMIMTGLRTQWGVSLGEVRTVFGELWLQELLFTAKSKLESKELQIRDEHLIIPAASRFLSDGIAADLFRV